MPTVSSQIIDDLGGTSEVARMLMCPTSTVHSWRKIGIPKARLAHLKLAAQAGHKDVPAALEEALAGAERLAA